MSDPHTSNATSTPLGDITPGQFIKDYWQKKPLVIRQGFQKFTSPISAEELAGLACEEDVHSRIVIEKGGEGPWQLIDGPMDESVFESLPETHWTLLVNDVEKHLPQLSFIVDAFRFIPEWRMDDLMISFAPEGGTVGPHLDQYDVFILQAKGHRRWKISTQAVAEDNQIPNIPLRIQKDFVAEQEWLLEPGDIIYIPPGVTHYGVATDDCLSFSIGFRAPTHTEMLTDFIDYISNDLPPEKTYKDSRITVQKHSNEITKDALENVRDIFKEYLNPNHPALAQWFGRFVSDTKTDLVFENDEAINEFELLKKQSPKLYRNPASRFAFYEPATNYEQASNTNLFIDGNNFTVPIGFAKWLCNERIVNLMEYKLTEAEQQLLLKLFNNGQLVDYL